MGMASHPTILAPKQTGSLILHPKIATSLVLYLARCNKEQVLGMQRNHQHITLQLLSPTWSQACTSQA
jgi:hypothetical protein